MHIGTDTMKVKVFLAGVVVTVLIAVAGSAISSSKPSKGADAEAHHQPAPSCSLYFTAQPREGYGAGTYADTPCPAFGNLATLFGRH
jgi:hypothetical protein